VPGEHLVPRDGVEEGRRIFRFDVDGMLLSFDSWMFFFTQHQKVVAHLVASCISS
jgi:hypothetical protein